MKNSWPILLSTPVLYTISLLIMCALFVIKVNKLPPQIPLYYSRPGSDQQIVQTYYIFLLPLISLIFMTINKLFSSKILKDEFPKTVAYLQNVFIILMILYIFVNILTLIS